jgi:BON domain-containing protein
MKSCILLASALALAACSDSAPPPPKPAAKVETPPPAAVTKAPEAAPTPPEPAKADPNKELAARVKQALEASDSKLPGGAIDVTAAEGKVTLWGALPSEREVRRAAQLAGKVEGVKSVDNQLKVVRGS